MDNKMQIIGRLDDFYEAELREVEVAGNKILLIRNGDAMTAIGAEYPKLEYAGHANGDDSMVVRGDLAARKFIAYYLRDGIVVAAAGMDHEAEMAAILVLMGQRQRTVDALHPMRSSPINVLDSVAC